MDCVLRNTIFLFFKLNPLKNFKYFLSSTKDMNKWLKIIIILIVIAVIIFVVLPIVLLTLAGAVLLTNPSQIGTEGCAGFARLPMYSFQLSNSGLNVQVTNDTGRNISEVSIEASFDDSPKIFSTQYGGSGVIGANTEVTVVFNKTLSKGSHNVDLFISYFDGDFTRTATGSCRGNV